jgi:hypothetical protein
MSRRRVIPKRIDPLEGVIRPLDLYRPFVAIAEYNVEDGLFCSFGHSIHIVAAFAVRVSDSKDAIGTPSAESALRLGQRQASGTQQRREALSHRSTRRAATPP